MSAADRILAESRFDIDLARGVKLEEQLARILRGDERIEVKYQPEARTHFFIELYSRGKPAGLKVTTAEWWCLWIDHGNKAVFIRTADLKRLVMNRSIVHGGDDGTSEGVAVPLVDLILPQTPA